MFRTRIITESYKDKEKVVEEKQDVEHQNLIRIWNSDISCIYVSDRKLVERFGLEKCKNLDWGLIESPFLITDPVL